ncbi:MAG: diguanylate cyclase [Lentisphaerae bacterium]|nr:diguanylate cyclase [Lentisphaerota bacterium]
MTTTTTLGGWLVHVMRESDGALSLEEALHVIMDSMKEYFPCQSVAVILIDAETKELRIKISRQISYTFAKKFRRDGPGPTAERVVLEQQPMLLNDVDPASDVYRDLKLEHDFSSAVLAPIIMEQRGVGYIFCDRANHERFDDSDMLHLQVIGYLIGTLMQKFDLIHSSRELSQIDDASQVLKYKAFVPALATELQRGTEHGYSVTLAMIVVDAFRRYVDTYGIDQAHRLLAEVAGIVKGRIRDMDILARFGADEFILCLSGMTGEEAAGRLEAICRDVVEKAVGQGESSPVTVTTGGLALSGGAALRRPLQHILAALGRAMVKAKAGKHKQIVVEKMV